MTTICLVRAGSHLYGTDTPASDLDAQRVIVPEARAILLGRGVDSHGGLTGAKTAGAADDTTHTLARFVAMVLEGQAIAVELLFAPMVFHLSTPAPAFLHLQENRGRLVPRTLSAFVGYCRRQAATYGAKGDRINAATAALELLAAAIARHGRQERVATFLAEGVHLPLMETFPDAIGLDTLPQPGGRILTAFVVCGRKMPERLSLGDAHSLVATILDGYGKRARAAATAEGVDWKALSHAVRIGDQALELLSTGHLTLPRPNAAHLRAIKMGQANPQEVSVEIDELLVKVEAAQLTSCLPEAPDRALAEDIVLDAYRQAVCQGHG